MATQHREVSPTRQNTKLESEGAEFLVMGNLLIEGIFCYKAYVNFPGYDLIAINPASPQIARIQVKSRWATDYDKSFPIKNFNCDFVVHVALNRGYRFSKRGKAEGSGKKSPEFYVLPVSAVKAAQNTDDKWGKVTITNIPHIAKYKDNWDLIASSLK
jgi:hypothetical protein